MITAEIKTIFKVEVLQNRKLTREQKMNREKRMRVIARITCKQHTTVKDSNDLNEHVPDKNYDPEWMEMDGDYNQNITAEFR